MAEGKYMDLISRLDESQCSTSPGSEEEEHDAEISQMKFHADIIDRDTHMARVLE